MQFLHSTRVKFTWLEVYGLALLYHSAPVLLSSPDVRDHFPHLIIKRKFTFTNVNLVASSDCEARDDGAGI